MSDKTEEKSLLSKFIIGMVAGTTGGISQTVIGHPLDTIKVNYVLTYRQGNN